MVKNAGTHPSALGHVHDVEAAMALSVPCLFQTKAIELSNAIWRFSCALAMGSLLSSLMNYTSDEED